MSEDSYGLTLTKNYMGKVDLYDKLEEGNMLEILYTRFGTPDFFIYATESDYFGKQLCEGLSWLGGLFFDNIVENRKEIRELKTQFESTIKALSAKFIELNDKLDVHAVDEDIKKEIKVLFGNTATLFRELQKQVKNL